MATKKTTTPDAAKAYNSLKALLSARSKGTLPRGVKVYVDTAAGYVEFGTRKDGMLLRIDAADYINHALKSAGFTLAK